VTSDPLLRWRSEFPILESTRYLISNSLAAFAAIDEIRETGAWRRWTNRTVVVT
jgi:hypothetical protein